MPATGTVVVGPAGSASWTRAAGPSWRAVCWVTHAPPAGPPPCTRVDVVERAGAADEADPGGHLAVGGDGGGPTTRR